MPRRSGPSTVSPIQLKRIAAALGEVDASRARLAEVDAAPSSYLQRREAYARVTVAFEAADRLLREMARATRPGPYREWRQWRHRLSQLDLAKQIHLLAQADAQVLGLGSTRAVDTGMLGPAVGDFLHGECSPQGTPARYGLDLEGALAATRVLPAPAAAAAEAPTTAAGPTGAAAA